MSLQWRRSSLTEAAVELASEVTSGYILLSEQNPIQLSCCSRRASGLPFSPAASRHSRPSVTVSLPCSRVTPRGQTELGRVGAAGVQL